MTLTRRDLDQIAWRTLHERIPDPGVPPGLGLANRPADYRELGDLVASGVEFEVAWGDFLHEFYRFKTPHTHLTRTQPPKAR